MNNNYMSVEELKSEYIENLKFKLYYMSVEELENEFSDLINDDIINEIENAYGFLEISDETIYKLFSGINFVKEDFQVE